MFSVIFDMDGTLLDTQKICIDGWEHAGKLQGFEGIGEHLQNVCGMNRLGSDKYLSDTFPTLDVEKFRTDEREFYKENMIVRYKKGAKEILDFLKDNGIKIGLASGTSRPSVMHHLNEVDAVHYFDAIVCGTDVENGKPAPDVFLKAAEIMGVSPSDCYIFEDSENGILSGHNAGMKCIGVPDMVEFKTKIKELMEYEFETIDEAIEIFKDLIRNAECGIRN